MQRDGSDSARARSARIRASHDHEATQLESMRRNTVEQAQPKPHGPFRARVASAFAHVRGSRPGPDAVVTAESARTNRGHYSSPVATGSPRAAQSLHAPGYRRASSRPAAANRRSVTHAETPEPQ